MKPAKNIPELCSQFCQLMNLLNAISSEKSQENHDSDISKGHYFIARHDIERIFKTFYSFPDEVKEEYSFLDLGCGYGNIMLLAQKAGFKTVRGIEYNEDLIDLVNMYASTKKAYENTAEEWCRFMVLHENLLDIQTLETIFNQANNKLVLYYYQPIYIREDFEGWLECLNEIIPKGSYMVDPYTYTSTEELEGVRLINRRYMSFTKPEGMLPVFQKQ